MTANPDMSHKAVIEVRDVCFAYGAQEVLHNTSFALHEKDMVAVVGPNGGGKTTLLRLMLGLLSPRLGSVNVFGLPPRAVRRRIGYVPQQLEFDSGFPVSVIEVVRMGRVDQHLAGPYRSEDREAALRALEQVGMAELHNRSFAQLSGGERQRVLVAQAIVCEPDLLLMDEPTASVDALAEHGLYELFHELNRTRTLVLVSHNLGVVTRHVTHVLCVNRTAELHPIDAMTSGVIPQAYGGDLALLRHDHTCHVIDSSGAMQTPHRGEESSDRKGA